MNQKGFPNFSNSGQNGKDTSNITQKGIASLEKRFDEEFPPLVSEGKDPSKAQIPMEKFGNRSLLDRTSDVGNASDLMSQLSKCQTKQDTNFSKKDEALSSRYNNNFAFFEVEKTSSIKENSSELQTRESSCVQYNISQSTGSDLSCSKKIATSLPQLGEPQQTGSVWRKSSASPQQSGAANQMFDQMQNADNKGSQEEWDMLTHTLKSIPEGMNDSSDYFDFTKGQAFGHSNPSQSKGNMSLEKDTEFDMIIPMVEKFNDECNHQDELQQEEEEDPQLWLIPNINSNSQNTLGSQNKAFANSDAKRSNGSFLSNESTIDSDQLTNHELINSSLSGNSNSKSIGASTPTKMDSFRKSQQHVLTGGQINYLTWTQQPFNTTPQNLSGMIVSNSGQVVVPSNLNYGCSETLITEDLFNGQWGMAQGYQQQQFMSQGFQFYNGYMDQMQYLHPAYINQAMMVPQYMNQGANIAYNQRQGGGSQQKLKGRNQNKIPENEESSQYYDVILENLKLDPRTTLMIKNIPNKYDQPLLLQAVNKNHQDKFDFFYLPIDFKNKCNVGYAFINFCDPAYIKEFYEEFNGKKWNKFNSEKVCRIKYGRIQGLEALVQHFEASSVMNQQDKKLKPLILTKNSKNSKNGNIFPKHNLQNIEQLVRHQKESENWCRGKSKAMLSPSSPET